MSARRRDEVDTTPPQATACRVRWSRMGLQQSESTASTPAERSVLVVEDDPHIGSVLEEIFQDEGFRVRWTPRAGEALKALAADRPDLITLDLNLPDLPGEEVLERLAQDRELARIPVVVLSAYTDRLRPTPQVVRVMSKPFDLQELLSTIESSLAG